MKNRVIKNRYEMVEMIGKGGCGEVWRARRLRFEDVVAIKCIHCVDMTELELKQRMIEREAKLTAKLQHENIAKIYDLEVDEHSLELYLVMEYIDGMTLKSLIQRARMAGRTFDHNFCLTIIREVLLALDHAHAFSSEQMILHRDISPSNIMVTTGGHVKLIDFGISQYLPRRKAEILNNQTQLSQQVSAFYNPYYSSPSLFHWNDAENRAEYQGHLYAPEHDLFSLGVVFYELISQVQICAGITSQDNPIEFWKKNYRPCGPFVDHWLALTSPHTYQSARTLTCAIEQLPQQRYWHKEEIQAMLISYLDSLDVLPPLPANTIRITQQSHGKRRMLLFALILLLLVTPIVLFFWTNKVQPLLSLTVRYQEKTKEINLKQDTSVAAVSEMRPERLHFSSCVWLCSQFDQHLFSLIKQEEVDDQYIQGLDLLAKVLADLKINRYCDYLSNCANTFRFYHTLHQRGPTQIRAWSKDSVLMGLAKKIKDPEEKVSSGYKHMQSFFKNIFMARNGYQKNSVHDQFSYLNLGQTLGYQIMLLSPLLFEDHEQCRRLGDNLFAYELYQNIFKAQGNTINYTRVIVPFDSQLKIRGVQNKKIFIDLERLSPMDPTETHGVCYYQRIDGILNAATIWKLPLRRSFVE